MFITYLVPILLYPSHLSPRDSIGSCPGSLRKCPASLYAPPFRLLPRLQSGQLSQHYMVKNLTHRMMTTAKTKLEWPLENHHIRIAEEPLEEGEIKEAGLEVAELGTKASARDTGQSRRRMGKEDSRLVYSSTFLQPVTMHSLTSHHLVSNHTCGGWPSQGSNRQ